MAEAPTQSAWHRPPERLVAPLHKIRRDRPAVLGLAIIGLLICTALLAPTLPLPRGHRGYASGQAVAGAELGSPVPRHRLGRDIYSRVLFGGRITLIVSLTVVGACLLVGVPAGLIAGYYDNVVSHLIMRTADIFLAVPRVILALAMAQALGPSLPQHDAGADRDVLAMVHDHCGSRNQVCEENRVC